jgi:hypothetical protein
MNESQRANTAQTSPPAPSSATPNITYSFASSPSTSYDRRSSADAQVGIGLSLLQDLANGMDSSKKTTCGGGSDGAFTAAGWARMLMRQLHIKLRWVGYGIGTQDSRDGKVEG